MSRAVLRSLKAAAFFKGLSAALCLALPTSTLSAGVVVLYVAPTGQTATAEYEFVSSTQLRITLTETTPAAASSLTGGDAILTSVGFRLPDQVVIAQAGAFASGSVVIAPGSASVGFSEGDLGSGEDVSGEWGATVGGEKEIGLGSERYDFVSAMAAQTTPFDGVNRDTPPSSLDGPQGGLLDDSAARGGLGVIDNSVVITVDLDADPLMAGLQGLSASQQSSFLSSVLTDSVVEYGSDAAFGTPIPEPATIALFGLGAAGTALLRRRRRRRSA